MSTRPRNSPTADHAFGTKVFLQLTAGLGRSALPNFVSPKDMVAPTEISNRWLPNVIAGS